MIAGLKPYAEYRDSALPWLPKIPAHWQTMRNGSLFGQRSETGYSDLPILEVSLKTGVRVRAFGSEGRKQVMSDLAKYKRAAKGDLAYNTMRMWQGAVGDCPVDGLVSPAYVVASPRSGAESAYFAAMFRTSAYLAEIDGASRGIVKDRNRLYWEQFKQMRSPCPPPAEQGAIVRFLVWANGRLERAIRAKRKVIALLNEQKQAVIHRAVTRGLDPSAPLKPSGVPWLGGIPRHWEVAALRRYWSVTDCKHLTVPFVDDGVPLASVVEVQKFSLDLSQCKRTRPDWYRVLIEGDRKPRRGDLIYCRNASVGACALVDSDIDFAMGQDVCLIRSTTQNQRFLNYVLHSPFMAHQLEQLLVGSTFKRINVSEIKALAVIVPPRHEQDAICESLDADLAAFDAVSSRMHREIDLLREYRVSLIAGVVTGKLDVREAARQLPEVPLSDAATEPDDEVDEAELDDEETTA